MLTKRKKNTQQVTKMSIDNITDFIASIGIKINKTPESSTINIIHTQYSLYQNILYMVILIKQVSKARKTVKICLHIPFTM